MIDKLNHPALALSPARREQLAQVLATATLFLAGYGLGGIVVDLASLGL